jgi:alkanesulfonate monooxygenase SsuD/methylene tetrahydromethanopterin reductase-like flavin-dependent oxidoreductase (luciferase family)
MVQFSLFHLMPYPYLERMPGNWPVPHKLFEPERASEDYQRYLDQMALGDELGFDWVGCNEHHYSPYGLMSNPTLIGAALSQRTRRSRIAMLGALLPLNNPVRVAEEYAMLDIMTGGRLIAGFIRGIPNEYIAYGVDPSTSWERFEEAYDLVLRAWTEPEPFGWEGKHYQFRTVSIWPRPLQQPHPPILMSGGSAESAAFAARKRAMMGVVQLSSQDFARELYDTYRATARELGWEPPRSNLLVGLHTWVARTDAEARKTLGESEEYFYSVLSRPSNHANELVVSGTRYYQSDAARSRRLERRAKVMDLTIDDRIEQGTVLCGSPDTVVRQIQQVVKALDIGTIQVNFKIGAVPNDAVEESMHLFSQEVLPHVRDL